MSGIFREEGKYLHSTACACMGPQNGEPLCPCRMKSVKVQDGRYVQVIDLGPVIPTHKTEGDRFTPHQMRAKAISDWAGDRRDKWMFSRHKTESMVDEYDLSKKVVPSHDFGGKK